MRPNRKRPERIRNGERRQERGRERSGRAIIGSIPILGDVVSTMGGYQREKTEAEKGPKSQKKSLKN